MIIDIDVKVNHIIDIHVSAQPYKSYVEWNVSGQGYAHNANFLRIFSYIFSYTTAGRTCIYVKPRLIKKKTSHPTLVLVLGLSTTRFAT